MDAKMLLSDAMFFEEVNKRRGDDYDKVEMVELEAETAVTGPGLTSKLVSALRQINFAPLRPETIRQTTH